jgi:endogenous inhibitor of DNA gyrase (YacG/DUF329 family)
MKCPICKKPVADDGPERPAPYPFCSERCKLIDLGRWLDGKYQIPVAAPDDDADPPADAEGR